MGYTCCLNISSDPCNGLVQSYPIHLLLVFHRLLYKTNKQGKTDESHKRIRTDEASRLTQMTGHNEDFGPWDPKANN